MSGRRNILAFHQVSDKKYPGINNIRPKSFQLLLDLLHHWDFNISHEYLPFDETAGGSDLFLTFDDGYSDQFEFLSQLAHEGIRPVVFIPTAFIGKTNSWEYSSRLFAARHLDSDQIKSLSQAGVIFGSHGVSHISLAGLPEAVIKREVSDSKRVLEDLTGLPVDFISFPFGRTDDAVNEVAKKCGYRKGLVLDKYGDSGDLFILSRIPIYGIEDYYSLKGKVVDRSRLETIKSRIINGLSGGTIITSKKLK